MVPVRNIFKVSVLTSATGSFKFVHLTSYIKSNFGGSGFGSKYLKGFGSGTCFCCYGSSPWCNQTDADQIFYQLCCDFGIQHEKK